MVEDTCDLTVAARTAARKARDRGPAPVYSVTMSEKRFAYPIVLDLAGRSAVVVGGGQVALRKAQALAEAGARVTAVAPDFLPDVAADGRIACVREPYDAAHLDGAAIAIAATDDEGVNRRVADDARAAGVLVNVVDVPPLCDFIVPAQVRRGDLLVAITTGGAAPSLSRRLRQRLEREFGPEWADYLSALRDARGRVMAGGLEPDVRRRIFERLTEPDLLDAARQGPDALRRAVDAAVEEVKNA